VLVGSVRFLVCLCVEEEIVFFCFVFWLFGWFAVCLKEILWVVQRNKKRGESVCVVFTSFVAVWLDY
jgi:hypothetical protein